MRKIAVFVMLSIILIASIGLASAQTQSQDTTFWEKILEFFNIDNTQFFEVDGQSYAIDTYSSAYSIIDFRSDKQLLQTFISSSVTCYHCSTPHSDHCEDITHLNSDCDDHSEAYWTQGACEEATSCGGGGSTECSNPDGDEGQYSCDGGDIYECQEGEWEDTYDNCDSGGCSGDVSNNQYDVCTHPTNCEDPEGTEDGCKWYCENGDLYECEDGEWNFYDQCEDINDQMTGDCEVENVALYDKDDVCEESSGCENPQAQEDFYMCKNGDIYRCESGNWNKKNDCSDLGNYEDECKQEEETDVDDEDLCKTLITCSDTDGGQDFKNKGTASLSDGSESETDSCRSEINIDEYYCSQGEIRSQLNYDCSDLGSYYYCNNGECVERDVICDSEADTNEDGEITSQELADYSQKWLNNQVSRTKLGVAIQEWANGC